TEAISYLQANAPDVLAKIYDKKAQQFAERKSWSIIGEPCDDFAYHYTIATTPDFSELSEGEKKRFLLATLSDMNQRGMELLQSEERSSRPNRI
ncbi:MAG: hypothetical protein ACREGF_00745, partial [Candidatus Saccharimonadales bacterium]